MGRSSLMFSSSPAEADLGVWMALAGDPFMFLSCQGPACHICCWSALTAWCHSGIWRSLAWPLCQHGWLVLSCAVAAVFLLGTDTNHLFSLKNETVMKRLEEGDSLSTCTASWNQRGILHWEFIPVLVRVLLVPVNHEQWLYSSLVGDKHFAGICCLHLLGR